MTKAQFIALNIVGGLLAALILTNVFLGQRNQSQNNRIVQLQAAINHARQAEGVLRRLTLRIAQGSEQDAQLNKLLIRHELKASLMVDGKKKEYP